MADQTTHVETSAQKSDQRPQGLVSLAIDCAKLADLQVQLLQSDVRESWGGTWRALLLLAGSTAAMIAALPVGMFGGAEFLRRALEISLESSLLIVSGVVLALAAILMYRSARQLAAATQPLRRSAEEMRANLDWMRSVLHDDNSGN